MEIILETKRLNISIPTMDSLDNWCKLRSDPEVMTYIGMGAEDKEKSKATLQKSIKHYEDYGFCLFDIFKKDNNEFIGEAGLIYLNFDKKNEDVEVGYTFHKKHWGNGYATELAEAFVKWGFNTKKLDKIVACCKEKNAASSNVMKKCGMKYSGKYLYGGEHECDIYCINKKEL
jgi:[ribosomal protein S5]-alanine N-acetyltransferase